MKLAFITGSHAYGTPTEESDVDLVVPCSAKTALRLIELLETEAEETARYFTGRTPLVTFRFGRLQLILAATPESYDVWKKGTQQLIKQAPVTRDEAVALFAKLREKANKYE